MVYIRIKRKRRMMSQEIYLIPIMRNQYRNFKQICEQRLLHYSLMVVSNIANRLSQPRQSSRLQPSSGLITISSESESCEHLTPYSLMQQVNGRQEPGPIPWGFVFPSTAAFDFRSSRSPQRIKSFSFKCFNAVLSVRRLHRSILVS